MTGTMTVAGDIQGGMPITCLLYEGDITRAAGETRTGLDSVVITRAAALQVGDLVEVMDDAAFTYSATEGLPVVKKLASTGAVRIGKVIAIDRAKNIPASDGTVSTIATMVNNGYLRRATVVLFGIESYAVQSIKVSQSKGNCAAGTGSNIAYDLSEAMFVASSNISSGQGAIPLHRVTGSSSAAVTGTVLMAFTGGPILVQS